tara:strand:- start:16 stop:267 length:252 start_codon:yes stop_codon:yes gene_type:complete
MPTLNTLPTLIDSIGTYIMRNGNRAYIDQIKEYPDKDVTAFTCKGNIERMFRGKLRFKGYKIWHPSGRASAFESEFDIVKKEK